MNDLEYCLDDLRRIPGCWFMEIRFRGRERISAVLRCLDCAGPLGSVGPVVNRRKHDVILILNKYSVGREIEDRSENLEGEGERDGGEMRKVSCLYIAQ